MFDSQLFVKKDSYRQINEHQQKKTFHEQTVEFFFVRVEHIVGKEENTSNHKFLLSLQSF